jgi:gliding motility-associated-like protein
MPLPYTNRPKVLSGTLSHWFALILMLLFLTASKKAEATHAAGADLTYRSLGGLVYEITATFYRDCGGTAEPGNMTIYYKSASCSFNRTAVANKIPGDNGTEITMPCATAPSTCSGGNSPGIQKWVYRTVVTLPAACTDWVFSYRVCCRNCTVTTIQSPCSAGSEIYVEAKLNNIAAPQNNSPRFGNLPVAFVCLGQNFNYNQFAFDIDGDSVVTELITPKTSATGQVTFLPPYTSQAPLASSTPFILDPVTGDINFTPSQLQIGVLAIRANEYRNGILIGSTIRDIQVYTQSCFNALPTATGINGSASFAANACPGQPLCFNIQTADIDSLQITDAVVNSNIPGATITVGSGARPQINFCWTPTGTDVRPAPYQFTITVFDNACPYMGMQTYLYSVYVHKPLVSVTVVNPVCQGSSGGSATATVLPVGNYSYLWNTQPPQYNATATGLTPGTYTVIVADSSGCSDTSSAVIANSPQLIVVNCNVSGSITCQSGNAGSITTTLTGGTGPYNYLWNTGATTASISQLAAGTYTVTVTDAGGCTGTATATIVQPNGLPAAVATVNPVSCFGGSNGAINITTTSGQQPLQFLWNNGFTTEDLTGLAAGNYTVTVNDANGCSAVIAATVTQPPAIISAATIHNVACYGGNDGFISLNMSGGMAPYTFTWNNGASSNSLTGISFGNYTVHAVDANGCIYDTLVSIAQPQQPLNIVNATVQNVTCVTAASGSISLQISGGTTPYIYQWNNGSITPTISNLLSGIYSCHITDAKGCIMDTTIAIEPALNSLIVLPAEVTSVSCGNNSDGSINITIAGGQLPYTYMWSNGSTAEDLVNIPQGNYAVTITDGNGCTIQSTYTVNGSGTVEAVVGAIGHVQCFNGSNGYIDINVAGTNAPYTFLWSNGAITEDLQMLNGGLYTVTITDASGCDTVMVAVINQPAAPLIPGLQVTNGSCNQPMASMIVIATGGTPPYSYQWSNGQTTNLNGNLTPGYYMVTITDMNGCNAMIGDSVLINNDQLEVLTQINYSSPCDSGASIILNVSGGTAPYLYQWNTGSVSNQSGTVYPGSYSVQVTDASGCTTVNDIQVPMNPNALLVGGVLQHANCISGLLGSISLQTSGGTGNYSYLWNNGSTTSGLTGLTPGVYAVQVTDGNGCSATREFVIENTVPLILNNNSQIALCTGELALLSADSVPGLTYQWYYNSAPLNGATGHQFLTPAPGNYNVVVNSICGQLQSNNINVSVSSIENVSISNNQIICAPESVQLNASGGISYQWSPSYAMNFTNIPDPIVNPEITTTYSVMITDQNGCSAKMEVLVAVICDSVMVPNGFSPNGDGTNDGYVIDGIEKFPGNKLWIYNRWGNLVYKAKDYDNKWNGISNISGVSMGQRVPAGTYFYILDLNDGTKPKSGFLVIKH